MSIIIFQLMNNYYQDKSNRICENNDPLSNTPYFTFGYFDGLLIHHVSNDKEGKIEINKEINNLIVNGYDALCNRKNVVCYTSDEERNKKFWVKAIEAPYLFISLIRLKQEQNANQEIIKYINKLKNVLYLFSYDHSELVLVYYGYSYYECMNLGIEIFEGKFQLKKVYTISSVNEEKISKIDGHNKMEYVSILLKCSVRNYAFLDVFLEKLAEKLKKDVKSFIIYNVLGENDLLIEIHDVLMINLLECYLDKQILNHSNEKYSCCFYNIESQIIKRRLFRNGNVD